MDRMQSDSTKLTQIKSNLRGTDSCQLSEPVLTPSTHKRPSSSRNNNNKKKKCRVTLTVI